MANIYNLFKFLEKKRGTKTPLKVKFIYAPDELTDEELNVEGLLDLDNSSLTSLPDGLRVGGHLYLSNSSINSLPDNLKVGGDLFLPGTPITSLPNNLKVGGGLYLSDTKITSIPDNLQVGKFLSLRNTPLAKKYSEEEIRNMILHTGGYVKRNIYA